MNNGEKEYSFLWFIENYSYCFHQNEESLYSPTFIADGMGNTSWYLCLCPKGDREVKNSISLFLYREKADDGPESIQLRYELSVLASDGSALHSKEYKDTFEMGDAYGCPQFLKMDEVLLRRRSAYLPQDTLNVCCKMWKDDRKQEQVTTQLIARTRIEIGHISFLHEIQGFSALKSEQKKTIQIKSPSKNGLALSCSLFIEYSCCEGKVMIEITTPGTNHILFKCKLSLLDVSGALIKCGEVDTRSEATIQDIIKLPLSFSRKAILDGKSEYLTNDKLSLLCECDFSTGVENNCIETTLLEIPSTALNQISNNVKNTDIFIAAEKQSSCPSALDSFREIYDNQLLTDVEVKTKTKSFPAHKMVLCARSSVFKAMLTSDMKEKNSNCIQVDDLENDIVQQLLIFLYSDSLENLQWESANKLYYTADKYEVEKLKVLCSSFLVENLSTSNASELLLLADTHNDSYLRKTVEDYILENEEQVFGSDEWGNLMEINPLLVSKTMRLKYMRKP